MTRSNTPDSNPFGVDSLGGEKTHGRRPQKSFPLDCPSAIEERETRYFEYHPIDREKRVPK